MSDRRPGDAGVGEEELQEEEEDVSDLPLPAWMDGDSLAPPCQADMDVVRAIIDFAGVTADDVLYDLGCGDGRICIEAAESRGARACGVEIEEHLADKFRRRVTAKGLDSKVSVILGDLREVDLSDATVVVTYLLPQAMDDMAESHLLPLLRRGRGPGGGDRGNHCCIKDVGREMEALNIMNDSTGGDIGASSNVVAHVDSVEAGNMTSSSEGVLVDGSDESKVSDDVVVAGVERSRKFLVGGEESAPENKVLVDEELSEKFRHATADFSGEKPLFLVEGKRGGGDERESTDVVPAVSERRVVVQRDGGGGGNGRPCRIVCNTWGIPGAVAVKEAGVGQYGGVKLRLFTCDSLS